MTARQDGRIESGQSLRSAISSRAWNRAQAAADLVLGTRVGFAADGVLGRGPSQLVVPVLVSTAINNVGIGHVVEIMGSVAPYEAAATNPNILDNPASYEPPRIFGLRGSIPLARLFPTSAQNFQRPDLQPTGVIVGGVKMPTIGQPEIVQVCISGLCVARVAKTTTASQWGFVQPAVVRTTGQNQQNLAGVYEVSDFGVHRLLGHTFNTSVSISGSAQVTWGLVIL
jgi:hypothetical protein